MRRFRTVSVGLALLVGIWLVWRQVAQRRRTMGRYDYAPRSPLPEWSAAPIPTPDAAVVTGTAERTHNQSDSLTQLPTPDAAVVTGTAERTHNQSDSLTQPAEPAAPAQERADTWFGIDTTLHNDEAEVDTSSQGEAAPSPSDDLIRIEGIGPKISTIVMAAGISSFAELEATGVDRLRAILDEAGIHTANPTTWPDQAQLAAQGKWDELQELQDRIKNGRLEA